MLGIVFYDTYGLAWPDKVTFKSHLALITNEFKASVQAKLFYID